MGLRFHCTNVAVLCCHWLQVCALRMPADMLTQHLPTLLEGMLLWAEDSKNKFRQKVIQNPKTLTKTSTVPSCQCSEVQRVHEGFDVDRGRCGR